MRVFKSSSGCHVSGFVFTVSKCVEGCKFSATRGAGEGCWYAGVSGSQACAEFYSMRESTAFLKDADRLHCAMALEVRKYSSSTGASSGHAVEDCKLYVVGGIVRLPLVRGFNRK